MNFVIDSRISKIEMSNTEKISGPSEKPGTAVSSISDVPEPQPLLLLPFSKVPRKNFSRMKKDDDSESDDSEAERRKMELALHMKALKKGDQEEDLLSSDWSTSESEEEDLESEMEETYRSPRSQSSEEDEIGSPGSPRSNFSDDDDWSDDGGEDNNDEDRDARGWQQKLIDFRKSLREKRRHKGLRYFEAVSKKEKEDAKLAALNDITANKRAAEMDFEKRQKLDSIRQNIANIKAKDKRREQRDSKLRERRYGGGMYFMEMTRQSDMKAYYDGLAAEEARKKSNDDAFIADLKAKEKARQKQLRKDIRRDEKHTQEMLLLMRKTGIQESTKINPPAEFEEPIEADRTVTISCLPNAVLKITRARDQSSSMVDEDRDSYFNIDLARFRNIETLIGDKIGEKGAYALAQDWRDGFCMKVNHLNLAYNKIGRLGSDQLFDTFQRYDCAKILTNINLKFCDIPGNAMKQIASAVRAKALPHLVVLDLEGNLLRDHGVCEVASLIFDRSFAKMKRILLQNNECGDIGITAVYKAFEANPYEVCPDMEVINLRKNKVTGRGLARVNPCPNFLII